MRNHVRIEIWEISRTISADCGCSSTDRAGTAPTETLADEPLGAWLVRRAPGARPIVMISDRREPRGDWNLGALRDYLVRTAYEQICCTGAW